MVHYDEKAVDDMYEFGNVHEFLFGITTQECESCKNINFTIDTIKRNPLLNIDQICFLAKFKILQIGAQENLSSNKFINEIVRKFEDLLIKWKIINNVNDIQFDLLNSIRGILGIFPKAITSINGDLFEELNCFKYLVGAVLPFFFRCYFRLLKLIIIRNTEVNNMTVDQSSLLNATSSTHNEYELNNNIIISSSKSDSVLFATKLIKFLDNFGQTMSKTVEYLKHENGFNLGPDIEVICRNNFDDLILFFMDENNNKNDLFQLRIIDDTKKWFQSILENVIDDDQYEIFEKTRKLELEKSHPNASDIIHSLSHFHLKNCLNLLLNKNYTNKEEDYMILIKLLIGNRSFIIEEKENFDNHIVNEVRNQLQENVNIFLYQNMNDKQLVVDLYVILSNFKEIEHSFSSKTYDIEELFNRNEDFLFHLMKLRSILWLQPQNNKYYTELTDTIETLISFPFKDISILKLWTKEKSYIYYSLLDVLIGIQFFFYSDNRKYEVLSLLVSGLSVCQDASTLSKIYHALQCLFSNFEWNNLNDILSYLEMNKTKLNLNLKSICICILSAKSFEKKKTDNLIQLKERFGDIIYCYAHTSQLLSAFGTIKQLASSVMKYITYSDLTEIMMAQQFEESWKGFTKINNHNLNIFVESVVSLNPFAIDRIFNLFFEKNGSFESVLGYLSKLNEDKTNEKTTEFQKESLKERAFFRILDLCKTGKLSSSIELFREDINGTKLKFYEYLSEDQSIIMKYQGKVIFSYSVSNVIQQLNSKENQKKYLEVYNVPGLQKFIFLYTIRELGDFKSQEAKCAAVQMLKNVLKKKNNFTNKEDLEVLKNTMYHLAKNMEQLYDTEDDDDILTFYSEVVMLLFRFLKQNNHNIEKKEVFDKDTHNIELLSDEKKFIESILICLDCPWADVRAICITILTEIEFDVGECQDVFFKSLFTLKSENAIEHQIKMSKAFLLIKKLQNVNTSLKAGKILKQLISRNEQDGQNIINSDRKKFNKGTALMSIISFYVEYLFSITDSLQQSNNVNNNTSDLLHEGPMIFGILNILLIDLSCCNPIDVIDDSTWMILNENINKNIIGKTPLSNELAKISKTILTVSKNDENDYKVNNYKLLEFCFNMTLKVLDVIFYLTTNIVAFSDSEMISENTGHKQQIDCRGHVVNDIIDDSNSGTQTKNSGLLWLCLGECSVFLGQLQISARIMTNDITLPKIISSNMVDIGAGKFGAGNGGMGKNKLTTLLSNESKESDKRKSLTNEKKNNNLSSQEHLSNHYHYNYTLAKSILWLGISTRHPGAVGKSSLALSSILMFCSIEDEFKIRKKLLKLLLAKVLNNSDEVFSDEGNENDIDDNYSFHRSSSITLPEVPALRKSLPIVSMVDVLITSRTNNAHTQNLLNLTILHLLQLFKDQDKRVKYDDDDNILIHAGGVTNKQQESSTHQTLINQQCIVHSINLARHLVKNCYGPGKKSYMTDEVLSKLLQISFIYSSFQKDWRIRTSACGLFETIFRRTGHTDNECLAYLTNEANGRYSIQEESEKSFSLIACNYNLSQYIIETIEQSISFCSKIDNDVNNERTQKDYGEVLPLYDYSKTDLKSLSTGLMCILLYLQRIPFRLLLSSELYKNIIVKVKQLKQYPVLSIRRILSQIMSNEIQYYCNNSNNIEYVQSIMTNLNECIKNSNTKILFSYNECHTYLCCLHEILEREQLFFLLIKNHKTLLQQVGSELEKACIVNKTLKEDNCKFISLKILIKLITYKDKKPNGSDTTYGSYFSLFRFNNMEELKKLLESDYFQKNNRVHLYSGALAIFCDSLLLLNELENDDELFFFTKTVPNIFHENTKLFTINMKCECFEIIRKLLFSNQKEQITEHVKKIIFN